MKHFATHILHKGQISWNFLYNPLSSVSSTARVPSTVLCPLYRLLSPLRPSVPSMALCPSTALYPLHGPLPPLYGPLWPVQPSVHSKALCLLYGLLTPLRPSVPFTALWPLYGPLLPLQPSTHLWPSTLLRPFSRSMAFCPLYILSPFGSGGGKQFSQFFWIISFSTHKNSDRVLGAKRL